MPYNIIKNNNKYELRLKDNNKLLGIHKTKKEAESQIKAIEINKTGRKHPELYEKAKEIANLKYGLEHSARKQQQITRIYKSLGGEYTDDLKPNQKALKKWTAEDWGRDIPEGRYLPKYIREKLTPEEYLRTSIAKMKGKTQYVKQPEDIVEKIREIKKGGAKSKLIDGFRFYKSEKPNKKLKVKVNDKWIHFGNSNYEHYFDRTGLLNKKFNHLDEERRKRYLARATKIKDKEGYLTVYDLNSPNYYSVRYLW